VSEKILVVDDQRNMRTTLALMLRSAGYEVDEAQNGALGIERGSSGDYGLVISDLRMGAESGIDVLRALRHNESLTEVIVMTAYGTIESAVEAMRLGAHDYIQKPFTEAELLAKVDGAFAKRRLAGGARLSSTEFPEVSHFENIIGNSAPVRAMLDRVLRVAATDTTVLLTGESGTGKEVVARAIHAHSRRAAKPFVPVNCAAITETLLESELFGHARGAFTGAVTARKGLFEEAQGGTFFLDEVAEMSLQLQAKLLRFLESQEIRRVGENSPLRVDVRIVAATNRDLRVAVREKFFREDLYYRLNVARFVLPPLRERREDIPSLVEHFLAKYNRRYDKNVRLGEGVMTILIARNYPGNVRELENIIEQAVAFAAADVVLIEEVIPVESLEPEARAQETLADIVDDAERIAIEAVLREMNGSRERTAAKLGISATTLWRKMTRLGVRLDE